MNLVLLVQQFLHSQISCLRSMFLSVLSEGRIVCQIVASVIARECRRILFKSIVFFFYSSALGYFFFDWDNPMQPLPFVLGHAILMSLLFCCGLIYAELKMLMGLKRKSVTRLLISHFGMILTGYLFWAVKSGSYNPVVWRDVDKIVLSFSNLMVVMAIVRAFVSYKM